MWRSWLAHHVRDVGVGRSSRLIPTKGVSRNRRPLFVRYIIAFGKWRSWLARCVRDAEVGCSSHLFPTKGYQSVPFCRRRRCVSNWVSGRLRASALWGWDVWWSRRPVPEGGRYGKGQGGGFLSSERPGAEL